MLVDKGRFKKTGGSIGMVIFRIQETGKKTESFGRPSFRSDACPIKELACLVIIFENQS